MGGMHGKGMCMAWGVHGREACVVGGMRGRGACMAGGHVWQGDVCGRGVYGRRDGHCSGRYISYWNAFL